MTARLPRLVLVHGAGGGPGTWRGVVRALEQIAPALEVALPVLPGRPGNDAAPCTTVEEMARFVLATACADASAGAVVVGHSLGGAVAIECALLGDARVVGIALVSTGARLRVHPTILAAAERAARDDVPLDLHGALYPGGVDPELAGAAAEDARRTPPRTALADWRASDAFDRLADVAGIRTPTLVVGGTADALTPPKYARYLVDRIAGADLVAIEGAGHMVPVERPDAVAAALARFSSRVVG